MTQARVTVRCTPQVARLAKVLARKFRSDFGSSAHVWRAALIFFARSRLGQRECDRILEGRR